MNELINYQETLHATTYKTYCILEQLTDCGDWELSW